MKELNTITTISNDIILNNCDCFVDLKTIKDESVDLILTDPPFNVTNCKWDELIDLNLLMSEFKRIIKPNGTIIIFGMNTFSSDVIQAGKDIHRYNLVWVKPNATSPHLAKKQPMRRYEDIMIFYKNQNTYNPQMRIGKPYKWNSKRSKGDASNIKFEKDTPIINTGTRYPTNVLEFNQERGYHATGKPVELMKYLIETYSNKGDLVIDTFVGGGSVPIACLETNRKFIGFEKDKEIFENMIVRVNKYKEITNVDTWE